MALTLTHEQAQALIHKSLQSRLDGIEQPALDAHLRACADCAAHLAAARALDADLSNALAARWQQPAYRPAVVERRLADIHARLRRETMNRTIFSFTRLAATAAGLLVLVVALLWLTGGLAPHSGAGRVLPPTPPAATATIAPSAIPTQPPALTATAALTQPSATEISPADRLTLPQAQELARNLFLKTNPSLPSDTSFTLEELTSTEVFNLLHTQVFRVTDSGYANTTLIYRQGTLTNLGMNWNSQGATSALAADLDGSGQPALLLVYSYGAGTAVTRASLVRFTPDANSPSNEMISINFNAAALKQIDLKTIEVSMLLMTGSDNPAQTVVGDLTLRDGMLVVAPLDDQTALYQRADLGFAFPYPAAWQPDDAGIYRGTDGFFQIEPQVQAGSAVRGCEWAINQDFNARYGQHPALQRAQLAGRDACVILPGSDGGESAAFIPLQTPDPTTGYAQDRYFILRLDPAHLNTLLYSITFSGEQPSYSSGPMTMTIPANPPAPTLFQQQAAGLTIDAWQVVESSVDTPNHMEFSQRIPAEVTDRNAPLRGMWTEQSLQAANAALNKFGVNIALNFQQMSFALTQNGKPVNQGGDVTVVFPPAYYFDEQGNGNFALIFEDQAGDWLLTKDGGPIQWDMMLHCYTRPVYAGENRLITAECSSSQGVSAGELVTIKQNGEPIYTSIAAPEPTSEAVKGLYSYDGHWVLEVNGTLIVDGAIWNLKNVPAEEIFNFAVIQGRPFFFYSRGGTIHAWYDGADLPVSYAQVVHYRCCEPAAFNPRTSPQMVAFYAERDGWWYYIEIGEIQ